MGNTPSSQRPSEGQPLWSSLSTARFLQGLASSPGRWTPCSHRAQSTYVQFYLLQKSLLFAGAASVLRGLGNAGGAPE